MQRKCRRPPLLTPLCKGQALGRSFLHLETHWFLSLIVRLFVGRLLPSQTESQLFSACLNKQELSWAKSCCPSVVSNAYGIANFVPRHVGLVQHAGVAALGEKAKKRSRVAQGKNTHRTEGEGIWVDVQWILLKNIEVFRCSALESGTYHS